METGRDILQGLALGPSDELFPVEVEGGERMPSILWDSTRRCPVLELVKREFGFVCPANWPLSLSDLGLLLCLLVL